jgi:hypothetical protein
VREGKPQGKSGGIGQNFDMEEEEREGGPAAYTCWEIARI